MAITRIGNPAIADQRGINFRNIIINGDMSIAQRGTSTSGVTSGNYYTIDRFRWTVSAGDTVTLSQSTDVPSGEGFTNSYKVDVTTADTSIGADDYAHISHRIEGQNLQYLKYGTASAESLTASFWVKSTKTGTYCVSISKQDNTHYDYVAEYSISSSDTWEKKTITIAPDSNIKAAGGAIDNDNGTGLNLKFVLTAGSNRQGTNETWNAGTAEGTSNQVNFLDSTSNDFYLTGVQLEAGQVASDFEFLPHDVNLARCQRYFQKSYEIGDAPGTNTWIGTLVGRNYDTSTRGANVIDTSFSTVMRATPTLTAYSKAGTSGNATTGSTSINASSTEVALSFSNANTKGIHGSGVSVGGFNFFQVHYTAGAEL